MNNRDVILSKFADAKHCIEDCCGNQEVNIVLATKYVDQDTILWAKEQLDFLAAGENKVQEFITKYTEDINWHFIGTLQTNKAKKVVGKVELIHSLDRYELGYEINRVSLILNKKQKVLIEVNVGKEETKSGLFIQNVIPFIEKIKNSCKNIEIAGLMGMIPKGLSQSDQEYYFKKLHDLHEEVLSLDEKMSILSCGMSSDFINAIKYAKSNMVRLGQLIFDAREYKNV